MKIIIILVTILVTVKVFSLGVNPNFLLNQFRLYQADWTCSSLEDGFKEKELTVLSDPKPYSHSIRSKWRTELLFKTDKLIELNCLEIYPELMNLASFHIGNVETVTEQLSPFIEDTVETGGQKTCDKISDVIFGLQIKIIKIIRAYPWVMLENEDIHQQYLNKLSFYKQSCR